jgi:hypothetical protein
MFTPRGIFELKYFFGSHVATETGGACSATAIRALLKQLVAAEDARKPLSDSRISDILSQQGIVVAPHHRQVPRIPADSLGQHEKGPLRRSQAESKPPQIWV